jgi:hypothetical protein
MAGPEALQPQNQLLKRLGNHNGIRLSVVVTLVYPRSTGHNKTSLLTGWCIVLIFPVVSQSCSTSVAGGLLVVNGETPYCMGAGCGSVAGPLELPIRWEKSTGGGAQHRAGIPRNG